MPKFNDNYYDRIIVATVLLNKHHIKYVEKLRGKIEIGSVNYFANSNKWVDTSTGKRGIGVFSLINYIKIKRKTATKIKLNSLYGAPKVNSMFIEEYKNNPKSTL